MSIIRRNSVSSFLGTILQLPFILLLSLMLLSADFVSAKADREALQSTLSAQRESDREADVCAVMAKEIDALKREIDQSRERVGMFKALLTGDLSEYFQPEEILRAFQLDSSQLRAEQQRLQMKQQALLKSQQTPEPPAGCRSLEREWQTLHRDKQQTELQLTELSLDILQTGPIHREFLRKQLALLERLYQIRTKISSLQDAAVALQKNQTEQASQAENQRESVVAAEQLVQLEELSSKEIQRIKTWAGLTLNSQDKLDVLNRFWLESVTRDTRRFDKTMARILSSDNTADSRISEIGQMLGAVSEDLRLGITQWRNQMLKEAGWSAFFLQLLKPEDFFPSIYYELKMAPAVLWQRLSTPAIQAYQEAAEQEVLTSMLTSWILQVLGLVILVSILIRSAAQATSWLAGLQQQWLGKLESATGHSILSGLFWMLKPNASWIYILLVAQASTLVFADDWQILNLLAPLATLYAAFRALRIILEWGFSRTYTRSGLFLSNHTSEQLVADSQRMTWTVVYIAFAWTLVYAIGGGYSLYLVSLLALILFFSVLWLLMFKHATAVNKLTHQVLGLKLDVAAGERSWWLRGLSKLAWPFIFGVAQLLDILYSLNQKLMVFDMYRSFSVKLLRVRLDSKAEETDDEDDGAEPDQNYSDWMLREAPDNLLFDVGDVSSLLTPLKHWYSEKTDENLMVVIGESGSGKSTLVRRLPGMWTDTPVKVLDVQAKTIEPQVIFDQIADTLGIERFSDIAGLVRQDAQIIPQVLVIDSAHNLFLAEVGYLRAYKALLECMNAHLENVFWLVVMHSPSWNYLNCVFSREQRISHVFKMPRWSPMDIRKLILSRHQGGRRRLKYNEMLLSAAASSESSSVRAADSRVFNILWEQCGGNPLAAIELWLNAVKVKGRVAEVGVPQRPPSNLLNGLKDDLFFVYTAIVAHSELSTAEIMRVTHFSEPVVRHAIKQGINLGMIIRDESKRYKVDPYWYGTLSGFLHRKNMLWD